MNFWSGKKSTVIWSQLKKLHQEMQVAIQEKDGAIKNLQTINEDLSSYVSSLSGWGLQIYSTDACVWCKVHKNDHWKMDLDLDYHYSSELKRTLKEMNELAQKKKYKRKILL